MRTMWILVGVSVVAMQPVCALAADEAEAEVPRSVVQIFATQRHPDLNRPWLKGEPAEVTGSGVVMEGKRILTNSHIVAYATQLLVQPHQTGQKLAAKVVAVAPEMDLAVLTLEDPAPLDKVPHLPREQALPKTRDAVTVYGFPQGGSSLSVTKGIISRIELSNYGNMIQGLRIQIDAAINPGNSGGPAVAGGKMIGLAYSRLEGSDNIGYIIPNEEIELFLADIADGRYDGKPALFDEFQNPENLALRQMLRLDKQVTGAVVRRPFGSGPSYPLKAWDVVTRIGEFAVADDGMVRVRDDLRLDFHYLIQKLAADEKIRLTIVREGRESTVLVPVANAVDWVMPPLLGRAPSYFVFGPVVFSATAYEHVSRFTGDSLTAWYPYLAAHLSPLLARSTDRQRFPGEQLVLVASPLLTHRLAKGYTANVTMQVVSEVNGVKVRNLRHLVETIRDSREKYIVIRFCEISVEDLVFDREEILRATEEILADNGIRNPASEDLLPVWTKAK
jgi:S1-C subfamily serine protease